jgi:ubiquinone/menaquinone biosynthesis C-methylase UbiE
MEFFNSYEDTRLADAYSKLEFPGTYYLAYRDIPEIVSRHVKGKRAMDFGCGAGRSTRFLRKLGLDVTGVDISEDMIKRAGQIDPAGDYRLIKDGDFSAFENASFDLILSAFTFDNVSTLRQIIKILKEMSRILKPGGRIVNLVSSPEMYTNEWASFSTKDFPQNWRAGSGDSVMVINTDIADNRPVEDIFKSNEDYWEIYNSSGLEIVKAYKPLARADEPYDWVNETRIAPWTIYVLRKSMPV